MTPPASTVWKYTKVTYVIVIACWLLYTALSFMSPITGSSFETTTLQITLIRLSIVIPILLIWLIAARGIIAFKYYAQLVQKSKEAPAINQISDGLVWSLIYLVSIILIGAGLPYFNNSPVYDTLAVIRDHLPPLIALVAFFKLYSGSHKLRLIANFSTWKGGTIWVLIGFMVFTAAFVLAFALSPATTYPGTSRNSLAIISHEILLFSLILPYLTAWFLGLLAGVNIIKYAQRVNGIVYRLALRDLVLGIAGIIIFAVVLQLFSFGVRFLAGLQLNSLLLVVYALLGLYALGFTFVSSGAKKLIRIEVVE